MHRCYSRSIFHLIETTMYLFYFNQLRRKSSFLPAVFQFIGERRFFWKAPFWKDNSVVQSVTLALKTVSYQAHCILLPCQNSIQSGSTLYPPQFGMGISSFARSSSFLCHNHSRLSTIFDWGDAADPAWDALDRDWKYSLDSAVGTFFAFPDKNLNLIFFTNLYLRFESACGFQPSRTRVLHYNFPRFLALFALHNSWKKRIP